MIRTPLSFAIPGTEDIASLGKPPSMTDEQCATLYVKVEQDPLYPDTPLLISRWLLTTEQRAGIADGTMEILLSVVGGHPPVMLYTSNEFISCDPTTGEKIDLAGVCVPYGWVYWDSDDTAHWSPVFTQDDDIIAQRPASALEQELFARIFEDDEILRDAVERHG